MSSSDEQLLKYQTVKAVTTRYRKDREEIMITLNTILCPVDLSTESLLALSVANSIASKYGSSVKALHVIDNPHFDIPGVETGAFTFGEAVDLYKEERQEEIIDFLKANGTIVPDFEIVFTEGVPYEQINKFAEALRPDMIVMSSCTSGNHPPLAGCTTERTVRLSSCPVLSVRTIGIPKETARSHGPIDLIKPNGAILYPTDFSEQSLIAKDYATSFAIKYGAQVIILHVIESIAELSFSVGVEVPSYTAVPSYYDSLMNAAQKRIEKISEELSSYSISVKNKIVLGNPRREILKIAESEAIDLIVIGTHGRRGFSRFIHGSVAEHVVRHASCSVLSVKQSS